MHKLLSRPSQNPESRGALRRPLIASLYGKQTKRQQELLLCFSVPTFERITLCMRVLDVLFLSPPTYCTHLLSCSSAPLCWYQDTIVLPSTIRTAGLSQTLKMRQHSAAAILQLDVCSQTTGLGDSSAPAKNFTNASVRLCCYLQRLTSPRPSCKISSPQKRKTFNKIQQNWSKWSRIAFPRSYGWELTIVPTLIICFCQEMICRTATRENLLKPTRFFPLPKPPGPDQIKWFDTFSANRINLINSHKCLRD